MFAKISTLLCGVLALGALCGCSKSSNLEYGGEDSGEKPGRPTGEVSIAYLKSLYDRTPLRIDCELYLRGRVVSSDRCGNFYKTLVVEDASGGIPLRIDDARLFERYYAGAAVTVHCNGLTLGAYGGMLQLGGDPAGGYQVGLLSPQQAASHLSVSNDQQAELSPTLLSLDQTAPRWLGCLVAFDHVEFRETGVAWCEPGLDTDRTLIDREGNRLVVRTSSYATFARRPLPSGCGYIEGVLTVFNGTYQLVVADDDHLRMTGPRF